MQIKQVLQSNFVYFWCYFTIHNFKKICGVEFKIERCTVLGQIEMKVKNLACKNDKILGDNYMAILWFYGASTHAKFQINS